jgi:hypothetical protein
MNDRSQIERRLRPLQLIIGALSLVAITAAVLAIVQGAAGRNADVVVTDGLDHQYRYLAGAYLAVGLLALATAVRLPQWGHFLAAVVAAVFLGGLARLLSIVDVGASTPGQYGLVALECVVVPLVLLWHRRIAPSRSVATA